MNTSNSPLSQRREFLRQFSLFLGAGLLASDLPWFSPLKAAPAGDSPADCVRLGIVGLGGRGSYLLEILLATPGVSVAALCDDYEPALAKAMNRCGGTPRSFKDHRRMLEMKGLDGILIATPLHEHARMCLDAIASGHPVFCEKSLAYTMEECHAVRRAAASSGKVFQIGHQRLYSKRFIEAKQLLDKGEIGRLAQIRGCWHRNDNWRRHVPSPELERKLNWRLYRAYSAGICTELASHHLQVANWFLNSPPLSCIAYGSVNRWKDGRELDDNVALVFKYPGDIHLLWDSTLSNRYHGCELQFLCTDGFIESESGKVYLENPPPPPAIIQWVNNLEHSLFDAISIGGASWAPDLKKDTKGRLLDEEWEKPDVETKLLMAAFAGAIRQNTPIPGMIEHAYQSGIASLMAQQAIETGKEVLWPAGAAG